MSKPATEFTKKANVAFLKKLPFEDKQDYTNARRGLIAEVPDLEVKNKAGESFWNMKLTTQLLGGGAKSPDTVNPSYWRSSQVGAIAGLFEVTDGIWQVRGFDLANITFIRSDSGYIVIDPLGSEETATAAMALAFKHLGKKPIAAVVITHTHWDHFGGLGAVVSAEDVRSGKMPVIAPARFNEEVVNENLFVGRAMNRRACYQYGTQLPYSAAGLIGTCMGNGGTTGLIFPNTFVQKTGEKMTIDGVDFVFEMTPHTESPAQMCFYLPQFRALCMADMAVRTMHNLLPFRGAQVRSAKLWSFYLQQALELFGDESDVLFLCHGWPCWGREQLADYLSKQRDIYKFINDQTVRWINHGLTMEEIGEAVELPDDLGKEWYARDYYGHVNHNVKATYQMYMGWFDANPAHLHRLPPVEAGRRYVELMGGPEEVLRKAKISYDKGEYRWVAELLDHVVFAFPDDMDARNLEADALEQLGYQSESSTWRGCYLSGAMELRQGVKKVTMSPLSMAAVVNMPMDLLLDELAVQVDADKAKGKTIRLNLHFSDANDDWQWVLEHSAMNCWNAPLKNADAEYTLSRSVFNAVICKQTEVAEAIASGEIKESGAKGSLAAMFATLEERPDFWFNIVLP